VSLAASPDGNYVCVLRSGMDNGFSCYQNAGDGEWAYLPQWDRSLGLNLTTPPHGCAPYEKACSADLAGRSVEHLLSYSSHRTCDN